MLLLSVFQMFILTGDVTSQEICSEYCSPDPNNGVKCDGVTGKCLYGCMTGFGGSKCSIQCCGACNSCSVSPTTSAVVCDSCNDGFYLDSGECYPCSRTCATKLSSSLPVCRPTDGRCQFACQTGYYGNMCDTMCSRNCRNDICNPTTGACTDGCILPVLTGSMCQQACSSGCLNRECDQSGACVFSGCQQGFWGSDCSQKCSPNCVIPSNQLDHVCDQTNATCLNGCVNNTYWGSNCSTSCNNNCVNKKCFFETGTCLDGCIEGYEGSQCTEKWTTNNTNTIIVGSAIGGAVLLIIVIIVACCICKKCRK
ncbi:hypothetical protein ACF0H5_003237 [Mactra antiquata]